MRIGARAIVLLSAVDLAGGAHAQSTFPSNASGCPERTVAVWCPSQAEQQGWNVKFKSETPHEMADAYWKFEVWVRERDTILCMLEGGRVRINRCVPLQEVSGQ
jgi:hypothetical protein